MSKPIIEVKGISKRYKLGSISAQTMRDEVEAFFARFKKTKSPATAPTGAAATSHPLPVTRHSAAGASDFWALRDVSFDVQPGEVVEIQFSPETGKPPLSQTEMWHFQDLVSAKALEIVDKWIDFFILNKSIKPEKITRKIKS